MQRTASIATVTLVLLALLGCEPTTAVPAYRTVDAPSVDSIPYSSESVAENAANGQRTAVLYFARWAISADPKGTLLTPAISRSLADSRFVFMTADLTDFPGDTFRELKKQGFVALPVLVLYPVTGPVVGFVSETPESQIVAAIERMGR